MQTATGLPSGTFAQGAFYEPLIITGEGGLKPVPWLARSWKWSNGNKTLTLDIAKGAKWSDGKPLTALDVVYSLTAGNQNKIMDRVGLTGADNNIASIRAKGAATVVITLKTPDSQFISAILNRQFVVPQHIWSKVVDPATLTNPNPVGSGPFNKITRFTTQDYVLQQEPALLAAGHAEDAVHRARPGRLERRGPGSRSRTGTPTGRTTSPRTSRSAYQAKDPAALTTSRTRRRACRSRSSSTRPSTRTACVGFRKALSLGDQPQRTSRSSASTATPRRSDALGIELALSEVGHDPAVKTQAKQMATYDPAAAKKPSRTPASPTRAARSIDPKGNQGRASRSTSSRGWSDWVASNCRSSPRTCSRSGSTRAWSWSPTGAPGGRTPIEQGS